MIRKERALITLPQMKQTQPHKLGVRVKFSLKNIACKAPRDSDLQTFVTLSNV